ncbi:MAG TPA: GDSL-type esterase/lipase family protein [Candidatus Deferrimicrobium sp.]|nr:GDSL-type esterase/lipase family protein [Candidatus Deferrimicrobium sp.]
MNRTWKLILVSSLIGNLLIVYVAYKALDYRRHVNFFLDKYTSVVAEFSGRSRYEAENRRLASAESAHGRLVFFGSQVTEGWSPARYFPEWETLNRGIAGQRLAGYLLRFRPDVIELAPRAVVIEFSSYNFRPEFTRLELQDYVVTMAELARLHGIEPILTTAIPVRQRLVYESYSVSDSLAIYNRWLRDFCRERGYALADFDSVLSDSGGFLPEEFSTSHIELNDAGYERISAALREVLTDLETKYH